MQSSEYLMARVVAWIEEEYKQNMAKQQAAEQREKEHGQ
jgi:predicted DNA-binding transcriptional regulator AlpA